MCSSSILYYDRINGFVTRCRECNKIQVGFGNFRLTFTVEEFQVFCNRLRNLNSSAAEEQPDTRLASIPVAGPSVQLAVSYHEWLCLCHIIEGASLEMEMLALLDLFNP